MTDVMLLRYPHRSTFLQRAQLAILLSTLLIFSMPFSAYATQVICIPSCQGAEYCKPVQVSPGSWIGECTCPVGNFEIGLGDLGGADNTKAEGSICSFINTTGWPTYGLNIFAAIVVNALIALVVMFGAVGVVIGGYFYMTAGGNADHVRTAKLWIGSALFGIFLALIAFTILNFISPSLV